MHKFMVEYFKKLNGLNQLKGELIMFYQFDKYRNKNGYILLDNVDKKEISTPVYGSRKNKRWFLIGDEEYLFKGSSGPLEEIKEIINELISKQLNILTAEYDVAKYKGAKGVITKDFSNKKQIKTMLCLLCEINNVKNDLYTYTLALYAKGLEEENRIRNLKIWLDNHILDIFTCQSDRHFKNIAIFDDLMPTPRYDSSSSFLTISKYDKIKNFVKSSSKSELIERYKGIRTKLRIFPGDVRENSIDELLKAQNVPNDETNIPQLIKKELLDINQLLLGIFQINFSEIYYQLRESNIILNSLYQDYFKIIVDLKRQEYLEKEKIYRCRHL